MRGRGEHQRPQHGCDPRYSAASTSDAAAQQQAAAAAAGMNPYAYAPNPQYMQHLQNSYNLMLPHLFLQNQAALAAAHRQHQHQQQHPQQYQHGYVPSPTSNVQHRPSNPAPQDPPDASPASAPPPPPPRNLHPVLERAQAAAWKARDELALAGEGVTGWKVAQAALVALKSDSWGALGVQLHHVPALRDLFLIEGKPLKENIF